VRTGKRLELRPATDEASYYRFVFATIALKSYHSDAPFSSIGRALFKPGSLASSMYAM